MIAKFFDWLEGWDEPYAPTSKRVCGGVLSFFMLLFYVLGLCYLASIFIIP